MLQDSKEEYSKSRGDKKETAEQNLSALKRLIKCGVQPLKE